MDQSSELNPILNEFKTLVEIVARLRGPDGCPWDKEQSPKTLAPYAIEEAFELAEAIEKNSLPEIQEELGDFLFQVILQAQVAQDEGHFSLKEVISGLNEKMIRRHPHVFSDVEAKTSQEVWKNWDRLKAAENQTKPVFSYPRNLPALQAAAKIGSKTKRLQFDWGKPTEVIAKVHEELQELQIEMSATAVDPKKLEHELGDLLFSVAQLARHLDLEPEQCLRSANRRFENRFIQVLKLSGKSPEDFTQMSSEQKENLWQQAKALLSDSENS